MDARIDAIVLRTLEKERHARFQSPEEVRFEVETVIKNPGGASAPGSPPTGEPANARFSLAAAIFTDLSLTLAALLAVMVGLINPGGATGPVEQKGIHVMFASILVVFGLPAAVTAVTGFLLGARALGEIRASGGTKSGIGFAIFAVVAWALCFMALLILSSIMVPMPDGGSIGLSLVILFAGIPLLLASFVLIRGLRRWARGVEKKDGQRHFPGLTGTVLATLGLAILGPVLAAVIVSLLPASESHHDLAEIEREMNRVKSEAAEWAELAADPDSSEDVPWRLGKPEVTIPVVAQPGQQVRLRLILRNESEQTQDFPLGEFEAESDSSPTRVQLKVGTFLKADDLEGTMQALAAERTGRHSHARRTITDLRGWTFATEFPKELGFATPDVREIGIATSGEKGAAGPAGVLSLEMVVTDADPAGNRLESK